MTLKRIGLTGSVNSQARITNRRFTLSRVSLRRFPFPTAAAAAANYIEEVFSTYLYTGNGSTVTITNGIDLSTYGGLVWFKERSPNAYAHRLFDTARGATQSLTTTDTTAQITGAGTITFNTNGFTTPSNEATSSRLNENYVSWTFREQAKFFDVVTFTTSAAAAHTFNHNLGSTPGFVIIKSTSVGGAWYCYHTSLGVNKYLLLNTTDASGTNPSGNWAATSTTFTVPTDFLSGGTQTYVAYLFAHDAGGFGASGTDNVISCGSLSSDGSGNASVTLNYEPQWILVKKTSNTGGWLLIDNMRGWANSTSGDPYLLANSSAAEDATYDLGNPTATGFTLANLEASQTFIYIAIRRGPMKTPTSGTSVFNTILRDGTGTQTSYTGVGFSPDAIWGKVRGNALARPVISNRLTNTLYALYTDLTNAESSIDAYMSFNMDGFTMGSGTTLNTTLAGGYYYVHHCFKRAPGFFDIVCYTGTGSATTFNHNLTVVPELMFVKRRDSAIDGYVYSSALGNTKSLSLFAGGGGGDAAATVSVWNNTTPTSTVFSVQTQSGVNASGGTYIAYLFATLTGVSKVGSYTGTGTTLQVNCGFTAGARYVLIKRTDSTGDWYVWDSTRGIVAGNDPYLLINSLAAEVTGTDYIDPYSPGFEISSTAPAAINANGGTYIFLAIA